jgi:uncharacterized protein YndB with AHSA1/START domain
MRKDSSAQASKKRDLATPTAGSKNEIAYARRADKIPISSFSKAGPVDVKAIEENARILIKCSEYGAPTTVAWIFTPRPDGTTFVSVTNKGFPGDEDETLQHALDSTEGSALVLAGLKAFLNTT